MKYVPTIGLEIHAHLKTKTKLFCDSLNDPFNAQPNVNICAVCMGHPGVLPVINKKAIDKILQVGLALNCQIADHSKFDRKNYFYPDLPKGYQISQYDMPFCENGYIDISVEGKRGEEYKRIEIERIHLEEDAGKLVHDLGNPKVSHVDLNRCSTPLIEIVSGPDIFSTTEATEYLKKLRNILVYLEVCDGNMQEGSLRCDANISLKPKGSKEFGTRAEIKNLNSFKFLENAIHYEIKRQTEVLESGGKVVQETRLWSQEKQRTESLRSKEEAHDYRYFPDPDLLPLVVDQLWVEKVKSDLPELPTAKAKRFVDQYKIPEYDSNILTAEKALANYFEACISCYNAPKKLSNWIMAELLRELKQREQDISQIRLQPKQLARMVELIDQGTISGAIAKTIFMEMMDSGEDPDKIVAAKGLQQISDTSPIEACIDKILAREKENVTRYKSGKTNVFGFFVGAVMKEMQGKANPKMVNELLKKKLE